MPIELRILGGARSGHVESFDKGAIALGRHPLSDLRFDPTIDLDVSSRHGEIRNVDGRYTIFDAQSTNGTYVNGQRLASGGTRELQTNDVITFGAGGPKVSVRITVSAPPAASEAANPAATTTTEDDGAARTVPRAAAAAAKRSTGERIAFAVARQTRALRVAMVVLVVMAGGGAGTLAYRSSRNAAASKAQMEQMIAANAELTREFSKKLAADTALTRSLQARTDSLERIARSASGAQQIAAAEQLRLNRELQRRFTAMNPTALFAANESAIALITAQTGTQSAEATGFVATASGLVVTNRHVVVDTGTGVRATRIFVRLANNDGIHRARIVRVSSDSLVDLAILQIEGEGPFPAVKGVANSADAAVGGAVVTIGYPMGSDLPMDGTAPKPTLTMGVVGRTIKDLLQIDSFASHGSSGSPVFDIHGHVVGVVWGGPSDSGGRIVYAVPADRIKDLVTGGR